MRAGRLAKNEQQMIQRKTHLDALAIGLLVVCCAFWGLQQILIKTTVAEVPPMWQASMRMAGAAVLLGRLAARCGLVLRGGAVRLAFGLGVRRVRCLEVRLLWFCHGGFPMKPWIWGRDGMIQERRAPAPPNGLAGGVQQGFTAQAGAPVAAPPHRSFQE